MNTHDINASFMELCHSLGWKCTPQRLAIYAFLKHNLTHPDVDTVWQAVRQELPSITRESVYRILNEFVDKELIGRIDHVYSARYDSRLGPHGHFICERCGKIRDFDWPDNLPVLKETATGIVNHSEIRLIGLCRECLAALQQEQKSPQNHEPPA